MANSRTQQEQARTRAKSRSQNTGTNHRERVTTISLNLRGNKSKSAKSTLNTPTYLMDLRVHKPQALGMINTHGMDQALALINLAKAKELDVIAITDFYDFSFADEVRQKNITALKVLPGFTIRAKIGICEEVYLCSLFDPQISTAKLQECVDKLGARQAKGNEDFVLGMNINKIVEIIESFGGVCYPSKMDRTPIRQSCIEYLVEELGFRTFDLSFNESKTIFRKNWPKQAFNFFKFSAARTLAQAGNKAARLKLDKLGWEGIKEALRRE